VANAPLFTFTLCTAVALTVFADSALVKEAKFALRSESRIGLSELTWSITELPTEMRAAAVELGRVWRKTSSRVVYETIALCRTVEAKIEAGRDREKAPDVPGGQ
jgi:hypothetical protein